MIRKLAVLSALLAFLPGCEVILFYMLVSDDGSESWRWSGEDVREDDPWWEDEDVWSPDTEADPNLVPGVTCSIFGLYVDGTLVIPTTEPVDEWFVEEHCWGASIDYDLDGYSACCNDRCCSWGVGHPGNQYGLHQEGQWCQWSGMCALGLTCFEAEPDSGIEPGVCRLGEPGEWCDKLHGCGADMFCTLHEFSDEGALEGVCQYHVAVEGQKCISGPVNTCLAPMKCACPTEDDCKCWDGSEGDPCSSESCQDGLSCNQVPAESGETPRCYDGSVGDPCGGGAPCKSGLDCADVVGVKRCVKIIALNDPCDPEDPFARCPASGVCNTWYDEPTCSLPGKNGDPCLVDTECSAGLYCVTAVHSCFAGLPGDPCSTQTDCAAGNFCLQAAQLGHCIHYLVAGETCLPGDPDLKCLPGLVCRKDPTAPEAVCAAAAVEGEPCISNGDCAPQTWCLPTLHVCSGGHDQAPCAESSDCADGWTCLAVKGMCFNGNTGDDCLLDGHCAPGFSCMPGVGKCFSGVKGLACQADPDCGEGHGCLAIGADLVCVEFLSEGDPCGASGFPFSLCSAGLSCDPGQEPSVCVEAAL